METTIFYFSGTGNSLHVAKKIAERLPEAKLVSIGEAVKNGSFTCRSSRVGFVMPVYYVGLPEAVHRFVNGLILTDAKYVFAITTKGWEISGGALAQFQEKMKKKNIRVHYSRSIVMPFNDFIFYKTDPLPVRERKLIESEKTVQKTIAEITGFRKRKAFEWIHVLTPFRNIPFIQRVNGMDKFFSIDKHCIRCGICERVCPVANITMNECRPIWNGKCQMCLACYNYCPQRAIQYKGTNPAESYYHHPDEANAAH